MATAGVRAMKAWGPARFRWAALTVGSVAVAAYAFVQVWNAVEGQRDLSWSRYCSQPNNAPVDKYKCRTVVLSGQAVGDVNLRAVHLQQEGRALNFLQIYLRRDVDRAHRPRVDLEGAEPVTGRYTECLSHACVAEFVVDRTFIAALQKTQPIFVHVKDQKGEPVELRLPWSGLPKVRTLAEGRDVLDDEIRTPSPPEFKGQIRCAGAYELCAWKRIPGPDQYDFQR